jgi:hypothetical protein
VHVPSEIDFIPNEFGLLVPATAIHPKPRMPNVKVYLTYRDFTGTPMPETKLVELLGQLSSADCLASLAHIGGRLYASPEPYEEVQRQLIHELSGDSEPGRRLHLMLKEPRFGAVFFEQQLVHLARLVIIHADLRPHDDFDGRALYDEWMACLLGVTDLLEEGLYLTDPAERRSWEIRQSEINSNEDQLPLWALHHEVYSVLWPEMSSERAKEADDAFQRHFGLTIDEYFTVGSAVMAYFVNSGLGELPRSPLKPRQYFSSAQIDRSSWQAFFKLNARGVAALRDELLKEEADYGSTSYGSLTFERYPLVEVGPGLYVPISLSSLKRRITQGVFHLLSEAAEADRLDRRRYNSAFGLVFQRSVESTMRRGVSASTPDVSITADVKYDGATGRRDSTDVILGQGRDPVFIEVVSGPLQAATVTRGDADAFDSDVDRLVVGKARQLDECIHDFLEGRLEIDGSDPANLHQVWPVIITSHPFPHAEFVTAYVTERVRAAGHLADARIGPLAVVSAEELFFCEAFMQRGLSFLSLIRGWKSGADAALPFKNYLIVRGGGRAPGSEHFERRFAEATANYMRRLLNSDVTPDDVLEHAKGEP